MNIPTRLLVLQRLASLLEGPLDFKGEALDMTDHVIRGRTIIGEESVGIEQLPALVVVENPRPDIAFFAGADLEARKEFWTILITGVVEDNKLVPGDEAYWLYAAVETRLMRILSTKASGAASFPEHYMLGGLITGMEISPPVVRPPENRAISAKAFFFLPLRVGIAGRLGDPYTSVS